VNHASWLSEPPRWRPAPFLLVPATCMWAAAQISTCFSRGFSRRATASDIRRSRWVSNTFVADAHCKPQLVVDLKHQNYFMEDRPFRYETMADFIMNLSLVSSGRGHLFPAEHASRSETRTLGLDQAQAAGRCVPSWQGVQSIALNGRIWVLEPAPGRGRPSVVGTRWLNLLEFTIDICRELLLVPQARLLSVVGAAIPVYRHASTHARWVSLRAL